VGNAVCAADFQHDGAGDAFGAGDGAGRENFATRDDEDMRGVCLGDEAAGIEHQGIVGAGNVLVARDPFKVFVWLDRGHYNVGDTIRAKGASFTARVIGGNGRQLQIVKDGATVATVPVTSDDFTYRFEGQGPGRWRLQVMRGSLIDTVSSPIWIKPGWGGAERQRCR